MSYRYKAMRFVTSVAVAAIVPLAAHAADIGAEVANAQTHATLAAQATDIATVHMHLHHTVNCLVGPAGQGFAAKELNPCKNNGNGAIPDSADASKKSALQAAAGKALDGIAATDMATAQKDASDAATMLTAVK